MNELRRILLLALLVLGACRSAMPECEPLDVLLDDLRKLHARHWDDLDASRAQELWPRPLRSQRESETRNLDGSPYCANAWSASTVADLENIGDCAVILEFDPNYACAVRLSSVNVARRFATQDEARRAMSRAASALVVAGATQTKDEPDHREWFWRDASEKVRSEGEMWVSDDDGTGRFLHIVLSQLVTPSRL